ncbi:MAG: cbb3-type cytochrome c oxidase subunit I, partial [Dehalococcoidales bacterium]
SQEDGMSLLQELKKTHPSDRNLMAAYGIAGLISLVGAFTLAAILVVIRTPAFGVMNGELYYRMLTGHTILGFIYWFAFIQGALMIAGATALRSGRRLWSLKLGWFAFAFTSTGLVINMIGVFTGAAVLYTAFPPLAETFPTTPFIYLGYLFAAAGAFLIAFNFFGTVFTWVEKKGSIESWKKMLSEIHISTFSAICSIPLLASIALVAFFLYIPALSVSMGWVAADSVYPMNFRLTYHVMFHIIHYIPAMAMIAAAYVLVELTTGATSVYSKTVAKALFLMYPAVVPPTFLYHLMADPSIPESTKIIGSALSLLVWIPSLLHMFIITGMMEAKMRSAGHSLFGWIKHLPWKNPAFASLFSGMITFGIAGSLTSVLLQEQTASLLHGTFAVPAYIHPMVVGAASLIYMGIIYYGVSIFMRRQIWGLAIARIQPYLLTVALIIFAWAGTLAGYAGVPRRTAEISYGGLSPQSWEVLMNVTLGVGGSLTLIAGVLFFVVIGMTMFAGKKLVTADVADELSVLEVKVKREFKYTPTALIPGFIFVIIVLTFTAAALGMIGNWPIMFG